MPRPVSGLLDTRLVGVLVAPGVSLPGTANRSDLAKVGGSFIVGCALEERLAKSTFGMECDMTMHEPRARVVGLERENQVAAGREIRGIATNGVIVSVRHQ